jgi:hypothetical protein
MHRIDRPYALSKKGTLDRGVRLAAGIILLVLVFTTLAGIWQIGTAIVGLILLATGASGFCPLYTLFGISTCPRQPTTRR